MFSISIEDILFANSATRLATKTVDAAVAVIIAVAMVGLLIIRKK